MCLFWCGRILENGVKLYFFDENRYELLKFFYNFVFRKALSNSTYDIFWSILELVLYQTSSWFLTQKSLREQTRNQ